MRVLLANKFLYPRGGAERAVLTLGSELTRRGHSVRYFGMPHPDNAVHGADVGLVRWRDYRRPGAARWRDAIAMLYSLEARRQFARFLDDVRPDVVHVHNIYHQMTPSILDAARARGIPIVMTLHDYKLVCPRYDLLRHGAPCDACVEQGPTACLRHRCAGSWGASLLLTAEALLHRARGSYGAVSLFLAPSRFLLETLVRSGVVRRERLRHLPNFALAAPEPGAAPRSERFLYAGRLSPEKGVVTLVRAAARLRRGELVLCGTGPLERELRRLAAGAPAGRIQLRGHLPVEDLRRETVAASFAVAPSEWFENAPFAILEAMGLGRAVLASRLGGLPELVEDGLTGELLPPADVAAWSAALERALDDPERMRRLGEQARQRVQERFALEKHVASTEDVYREVTR